MGNFVLLSDGSSVYYKAKMKMRRKSCGVLWGPQGEQTKKGVDVHVGKEEKREKEGKETWGFLSFFFILNIFIARFL